MSRPTVHVVPLYLFTINMSDKKLKISTFLKNIFLLFVWFCLRVGRGSCSICRRLFAVLRAFAVSFAPYFEYCRVLFKMFKIY